jgi:hypothetical protein
MLQTGQVEVSNAATQMSAVRLATVDFTVPIGESRYEYDGLCTPKIRRIEK